MRKITLDIETIGEISGPVFNPLAMDLTVIAIHDSATDEYSVYTAAELPKLWPILERADMLIGYNSDHFDIPIINKYYSGDLTTIRGLDLLKEIKNVLGRRLKLDSIAEGTLGRKKTGSGLQSIEWWKNGEFEKVKQYCIEDVRITRDIYDYARKNRSLKYKDYDGVREIKLDTTKWEKATDIPAITHTLPF